MKRREGRRIINYYKRIITKITVKTNNFHFQQFERRKEIGEKIHRKER